MRSLRESAVPLPVIQSWNPLYDALMENYRSTPSQPQACQPGLIRFPRGDPKQEGMRYGQWAPDRNAIDATHAGSASQEARISPGHRSSSRACLALHATAAQRLANRNLQSTVPIDEGGVPWPCLCLSRRSLDLTGT